MTSKGYAHTDEHNRLLLSPDLAARYGIQPGTRLDVEQDADGLHIRRPVTHLAKLYIEPTNLCNLDCRTCIRNVWDEPSGMMTEAVFKRTMEGLRAFSPPPTVFFGGFGEPLFHPRIVEMVAQAKAMGASVELITNGTMLNARLARDLIAAGLDLLWVSIDGATPASYADVRLGAELPKVVENVKQFRDTRRPSHRPTPEIGIAFVAMKRNIAELPALIQLGRTLGASRFLITNVLPHTQAMRDEVLYQHALSNILYLRSIWVPHLSLPKMDLDETTRESLHQVMRGRVNISWVGANLGGANDRCPFIENGAGVVGWDGGLSPCLPLLHSYTSFLNDRKRFSRRWLIGNVQDRNLYDLWNAREHLAFRKRVQDFDFAPCTFCGGCDLAEANEEDCIGNTFPTCGGCLWAQGVIRCP